MDDELVELLSSFSLTEKEKSSTPLPPEMKPSNPADTGMHLVGRVFNSRPVNPEAFTRTMKVAFNLIKNLEIKSLGQNRFTLRFAKLGDFNRILKESPWHYEHHLLLLTPLLRHQQWDEVDLDWVTFQVQVRGIPYVSYTEELARIIGNRIGRYVDTDLNKEWLSTYATLRFRASVDTRQPLMRLVRLHSAEGNTLTGFLSYEKLPLICEDCGMLDHVKKDCEIPPPPRGKLPVTVAYGPWLRAKPPRSLGVNFNPPSRRGNFSSSFDQPPPHNGKKEQPPDDSVPKQSGQASQETVKGDNVSLDATDETMQPQEEVIPSEELATNMENTLTPLITDPSPSELRAIPLPLVTTTHDVDIIMTSAMDNLDDSTHCILARRSKRVHEEMTAQFGHMEVPDQHETRALKILKQDSQASDASISAGLHILSWNCQGMGSPWTVRRLKELIGQRSPSFVFLCETKSPACKLNWLKNLFPYYGFFVDAVGASGGLALLWRKELDVSLLSYSKWYIDVNINNPSADGHWRLTGFYGNPVCSARSEFWDLLRRLHRHSLRPWICVGDFNEVLFPHEFSSRVSRHPRQMEDFRKAVVDCGLNEIPFQGHSFTWTNKRKHPHTVRARLDRALASVNWLQLYPMSEIQHLSFGGSDHAPLWVQFTTPIPPNYVRRPHRFRFEARWMSLSGCESAIRDAWSLSRDPSTRLQSRLSATRISLLKWYQHQIGPLKANIKRVEAELATLAVATLDDSSLAREKNLRNELDDRLEDGGQPDKANIEFTNFRGTVGIHTRPSNLGKHSHGF
ncbi:hypothetical protein M569_13313 [Genlisea aurea]|uniref:DUF4283 domain-containing protein n=1 Tax=Genlisea aurea TaxID=192259 RepID=S8C4A4_9LAMI|nr:hypothetical protein M569_13313 [Genlisea aurea]